VIKKECNEAIRPTRLPSMPDIIASKPHTKALVVNNMFIVAPYYAVSIQALIEHH